MNPEILHGRLQEAVDAKAYAVKIYLRSQGRFIIGGEGKRGRYTIAYARLRDDGLVEAGEEYEHALIDPADVTHVVTVSGDHPEYNGPEGGSFL